MQEVKGQKFWSAKYKLPLEPVFSGPMGAVQLYPGRAGVQPPCGVRVQVTRPGLLNSPVGQYLKLRLAVV